MQSVFFSEQTKTTISYIKKGKGKSLLFIHGLGLDKSIWSDLTDLLCVHFTCYSIDIPGSGFSEYIPNASLDVYANIVYELINRENLGQVFIIGHSFGGYIALKFASLYLNCLSGLCLFHSTAFEDSLDKKENRKQIINVVKEKGVTPFFKNLITNQFAPQNKLYYKKFIDDKLCIANQMNSQTLIQYQENMLNRSSFGELISRLAIPIWFIVGKYDVFIDFNSIIEQALITPFSKIIVLNDSGHLGMIEETQKVANDFVKFY